MTCSRWTGSVTQGRKPALVNSWQAVLLCVCICLMPSLTSLADDLGSLLTSAGGPANSSSEAARLLQADGLHMIDTWQPIGRQRFLVPESGAQAKTNRQLLGRLLDQSQARQQFQEIIQRKIDQAMEAMANTARTGDQAAAYRWRWRAEGLRSLLSPPSKTDSIWQQSQAWDTQQVARSNSPHSVVQWSAGGYSITRTPNFSIASQAGERPTAEMATRCELAFALWKQLFFEFWAYEQTVAPEFAEPAHEPFHIVLFRNREGYTKALKGIETKISLSTGYYNPHNRTAFFYWDGSKSMATLVHELTHQFFNEAGREPPSFDSDHDPGFWVIEGVALYMESLSIREVGGMQVIDIGGWDSPRLQAGRYRRLHDEYWIPWEEFQTADGQRFRTVEELPAWYSQACGLSHRWLDGSPEDASTFTKYLRAVYAGRGNQAARELVSEDDALRSDYDQFLLSPTNPRPYFSNRNEVVLSRCDVHSRDLLTWPVGYRKMAWLDLSHTRVDDGWLVDATEPAWDVMRLNLESTQTTDAALPLIARMESLTELDLTHCKITDTGLATLRGHQHLRQLWLVGTAITDAALPILETMPRLERVVIDGTQVSDGAWKAMLGKRPQWRR